MKKIIAVAIVLSVAFNINVQSKENDTSRTKTPKTPCTRKGLWYTPVARNRTIDGIGIGLVALPVGKAKKLVINGINIEADPVPLFCFPPVIFCNLYSPFSKEKDFADNAKTLGRFKFRDNDTAIRTAVNGLSISTCLSNGKMNGVAINVVCALENEMNGLEVSGLMNMHYSFKGLMIAMLRNKVTKVRGVQIGLINDCKDGRVFQIGLLNTIGRRTIPFINFRLKRAKKI